MQTMKLMTMVILNIFSAISVSDQFLWYLFKNYLLWAYGIYSTPIHLSFFVQCRAFTQVTSTPPHHLARWLRHIRHLIQFSIALSFSRFACLCVCTCVCECVCVGLIFEKSRCCDFSLITTPNCFRLCRLNITIQYLFHALYSKSQVLFPTVCVRLFFFFAGVCESNLIIRIDLSAFVTFRIKMSAFDRCHCHVSTFKRIFFNEKGM